MKSNSKKSTIRFVLPASLMLGFSLSLLQNCGGKSVQVNTSTPVEAPQNEATAAPSFSRIRSQIFEHSCLACHAVQSPRLGTYAEVIAALPQIETAVLRNKTMPKGRPLSDEDLALLKSWIEAGAPEMGSAEAASPVADAPKPDDDAPIVRPVLFAQVKKMVFDQSCIRCHAKNNNQGLTELETYESVESVKDFIRPLVSGRDGDTVIPPESRMPPPNTKPLTERQKALIMMWIEDGAKNEF